MRKIFIITIFLFCFSVFVNAQQVPDYLFLEVIDSKGQSVPKAEVQTIKGDFNSLGKGFTDEKGSLGFYLPWESKYDNLTSFFTVIKEGFFTYYDLGGSGHRGRSEAKIELLKIPNTKKEKKILGEEQLKRELMWAAKTGDAETVKNLLKKGINPNLTTTDLRGVSGRKDVPAILFATLSADPKTIDALFKAGAKISIQENSRGSLLTIYLQSDPFLWNKPKTEAEQKEILQNYEKGVKIFIEAGVDINAADSNRNPSTAISIAAYKGYTNTLKLLMSKILPTTDKDKFINTLLEYATSEIYERTSNALVKPSRIETVNYLLQLGADPNQKCGVALSSAAYQGDIEVIKTLLGHGAKIDLPDCGSPLYRAVGNRQIETVRYLIESGANINVSYPDENLLTIAAARRDVEMIKLLIEKGLPVNTRTQNGATALLFIYGNDDDSKKTIEILLQSGANPNLTQEEKQTGNCYSPLMKYAHSSTFRFIKLLIENGADVNLACSNGKTALSEAIKRYQPEVIQELLKYGANPNGEQIDKSLSEVNTYYQNDSYYRKYIDETIKLIEEARTKQKLNN